MGPDDFLGSGLLFFVGVVEGLVVLGLVVLGLVLLLPVLFSCLLQGGGGGMVASGKFLTGFMGDCKTTERDQTANVLHHSLLVDISSSQSFRVEQLKAISCFSSLPLP